MKLRGATIMILGGSGLVGHAVARRLLARRPRRIVLVALLARDTEATAAALRKSSDGAEVCAEAGNVYVSAELAGVDRGALLEEPGNRRRLVDDVFGDLTEDVLGRSFLVQLLLKYRPDAVVDCINTATAFAYQDVYGSTRALLALAAQGRVDSAAVERHALTLPLPQLTRHIQVLVEALRRAGTQAYVKIGTSGTGGMGFNIPYTHSEERPSRTLLTKSAVAGAHTLLLYLLGRTPGAPATVEIKPTAAIGWREIAHGPVLRWGRPIELYDCPEPVELGSAFGSAQPWRALGRVLEAAYINMGENGLFSREEFATITALGQMEFITPEEIADYVVFELEGHPTGRDVVAALEGSTAGPTYRAGILREAALRELDDLIERHRGRSVGFEMLGPPRLTKLLYEAHLLSCLRRTVGELSQADPDALGEEAEGLLAGERLLRAEILSVGIPIVSRDGRRLRRGPSVAVPPTPGEALGAAPRGWLDLRPANMSLWVRRAGQMVGQASQRRAAERGSGSDEEWDAVEPEHPIIPWRMATWVFRFEDQGERIKR